MPTPRVLLFLDFGGGEIIIIFLVILIVLGPDKIPEFAKKAGEVLRYVRRATDDIKKEINKETEAIQKPIKSAYKGATEFSENARKSVYATLDEIESEIEDKPKKNTSKEAESKDSNNKNSKE